MLEATRFPEMLGEYEVVGRLGRGGVGYVLEVRSRTTGASYAAKLIINSNDALARERFRREAELLARCDRHPGVVKVHAFGETPAGDLYMIMDLVRGEGLDRLLEREGRLEPRRAAALGRDVAEALGHAHALGIVHRDVKPSNILLDETGSVRLTDFGLATACDLDRLTRSGTFLGTVWYCAPEQSVAEAIDPPADVFAVGCLLFRALTGRAPLEHLVTAMEVFRALNDPAPIPDVRTLEPSCPAPLAGIVACALEKDPDLRYPGGAELALDLAHFLAGEATSDHDGSARRRRRGRRALVLALALALLGSLIVAGRELERTIAARAELKASGEHLANARAVLARRTGAPTQSELVFAFESSRRAREGARRAASLGASGAEEARRLAEASLREATVALARRHLALGDAAAALALLDAIPEDASAAEARLDRARALFLLGRLDAGEAGAVGALALGSRRAEALELVGDVFRVNGELARAEAAYGAALDVASTRQRELRRKRGAVAALAGDDAVAVAELAALVPDLSALLPDRAANAALAELAPALYRRALACSLEACERDLDLAWRLAAPPAELASAVADRWIGLAEPGADRWSKTSFLLMTSDAASLLKLRGPLALLDRAREADPRRDSDVFWKSFELLATWERNAGWTPAARMAVARELLAACPRDPFLIFFVALCLRSEAQDPPGTPAEELARRTEQHALVEDAIDRFPPFRVGEPAVIADTSWTLANLLVDFLGRGGLELDARRLRHVADRGDAKASCYWFFASRYLRIRGKPREALEALDRQPGGESDRQLPPPRDLAEERVLSLFLDGRAEEAVTVLLGSPGDQRATRSNLFKACHRCQEELEGVPATASNAPRLLALGEVYALLGRVGDAENALARLRNQGAGNEAAKLASVIERAKRSGG
jgi:serine/threonine-protein kinase